MHQECLYMCNEYGPINFRKRGKPTGNIVCMRKKKRRFYRTCLSLVRCHTIDAPSTWTEFYFQMQHIIPNPRGPEKYRRCFKDTKQALNTSSGTMLNMIGTRYADIKLSYRVHYVLIKALNISWITIIAIHWQTRLTCH